MGVQRHLYVELIVAVAACHHAPAPHGVAAGPSRTTEVTLFTDGAFVEQAIDVEVGDAPVAVHASVPYDVAPEDIIVVERGSLEIGAVHTALAAHELAVIAAEPSEDVEPTNDSEEVAAPPGRRGVLDPPRAVEVIVRGPRGHHVVHLGYLTTAMVFSAAYTITTTAARDRATVRGALAIENLTNVALLHADVTLVDRSSDEWSAHQRATLLAQLGGPPVDPGPVRHPLGMLDLVNGQTRVELLPDEPPRQMRSVLVYDPFGTALDNPAPTPRTDTELGLHASTVVTESFAIERPARTVAGMPGGPVRLLERRHDGSVAVLGESRLFDAATQKARVDTIPVGTADGVTARRERVELTVDLDLKRVVEEIAIVVVNARSAPIDVVLREHAYRGATWTLAYQSTPTAELEGTQQFAMHARVAPNTTLRTSHTVVYRW